jgi:putative ABC transport system substrate-binding protein
VRRRTFISLLGGAAAGWPLAARAQQGTVPVLGWLGRTTADASTDQIAAFTRGLKEAGYVDGHNVAIEYRWGGGQDDRLPTLAADLVHRRVSVIAALTASAVAASAATSSIPIVFLAGSDPIALRLVRSFNRPGGNATGATLFTHALNEKRLELIRELVPTATVIGILLNPNNPRAALDADDIRRVAHRLGQQVHVLNATNEHEISAAFAAFVQLRADALVVGGDSFLHSRDQQVIELAARYAIPAIGVWRQFASAGAVSSAMEQCSRIPSVRSASMQAGFSAEKNRPIFRCNSRLGSSWRSTSRPPKRSASKSRRPCSPARTR